MKIEEVIGFVDGNKWVKMGSWECTIFGDSGFLSVLNQKNLSSVKIPFSINELLAVKDDYFFLKKDWDALFDLFYDEINKDVDYLDLFSRELNRVAEDALAKLEKAETIEEFFSALEVDFALGIAMHPLDSAIERYLIEHNYDKNIAQYVFPIKKSYMIKERIDLLKIKIKEQNEEVDQDLKKHAETYGWMNTINWRFDLFDTNYYKRQLELIDLKSAKKVSEDLLDEEKSEKIIGNYLKDKDEKHAKMLRFLRQLLDAKMLNWDIVGISNFKLREIFSKDGRLKELDYKALILLTLSEIISFKKGELSIEEVQDLVNQRKDAKILLYKDNEVHVFPINSDTISNLSLYKIDFLKDLRELKGSPAFAGKASGKAQIIESSKDVGEMIKGNVLVCPMTNPDFMPAAMKASAIVTDQGGVLCHAAIISRELRKPCIIGTKIATKVFKDGDLVEVDADKGVVKILEKR